jgi:hypothetical protein
MPARHYIAAIILFWVATAGWLFYREFWPALRPGEPPPFNVDLVDEARQMPIQWTIHRGPEEEKIGFATTRVQYHENDDTFDLQGDYRIDLKAGNVGKITAHSTSIYRVTRDSELRSITADARLTLEPAPTWPEKLRIEGHVEGPVRDGAFLPEGHVQLVVNDKVTWRRRLLLEPVPVEGRGSVLDPLHPVNRIPGLRGGQHWRVPHFDPIAITLSGARFEGKSNEVGALFQIALELFAASLKEKAMFPDLDAEVEREPAVLAWGGRIESCRVIHFRGHDLTATTWVRESDDLVLQQEATVMGDRLVLKRNP